MAGCIIKRCNKIIINSGRGFAVIVVACYRGVSYQSVISTINFRLYRQGVVRMRGLSQLGVIVFISSIICCFK